MKQIVVGLAAFISLNAHAVTGSGYVTNELNTQNHLAATGQLIAYESDSFYVTNTCSGVFVSPSIFLSAGHCYRTMNNCVATVPYTKKIFNYSFDGNWNHAPGDYIPRIKTAIDSKNCLKLKAVSRHPMYSYDKETGITSFDISVYELENSSDRVNHFVQISLSRPEIGNTLMYVGYGDGDYGSDSKVFGRNLIAKISATYDLISFSLLSKEYPYVKNIEGNSTTNVGDSGGPVFNENGTALIGLIKGGGDFREFLKKKKHQALSENLNNPNIVEFLTELKNSGKDIRF